MILSNMLCLLSFVFATPDSATETALIATMIVTALAIGTVFFVMLLPEETRDRMEAALGRARQYFISGSTEPVEEFDHDFDGIRELDNRIPPWFTYLFVGTIAFGGVYFADYHVFGTSKLSTAEYTDEVVAADVQRRILIASEGQIDETQLVALKDASSLKNGSESFQKNCVSCHGANGQGLVGPNLTDQHWIHGGGIKDIFATIKNGVPAKGMISWQLVFTPKRIQEIGSYVLSLQGTNPIGAKPPQGELWVEKDTTTVAKIDSTSKL
jgi:cytochrome c oxidase cbb3-type subunit III